MQNVETITVVPGGLAQEILCGSLPAFERADLESLRRAFQSATPCQLQQAWRDEAEAGFSPGVVRTGWRGNSLLVFAELTDLDVFNGATKLNQRAWELGDVFEMFLRPVEKKSYVEFQVTPNNQKLQLRYPDASTAGWALKMGRLEEFFVADEAFYSMTWVESQKCRWYVFAEIPALAVCGLNESIEHTQWRFSFGRYDYTRGVKEPVASSTSPHAKPDFHRQHEWGIITFKELFA
jgi:hypothetical protein